MTIQQTEAVSLVKKFIETDTALSNHVWLKKEPFFVGTWKGYVTYCEERNLIHISGFGSDVSPYTLVAYRTEFTSAGSGCEDFFFIDPKTKKVQHIEGLKGR